ncbi:MAG: hypothetical protein QW484_02120 [Candidatus Pacearchaeota archaeon]
MNKRGVTVQSMLIGIIIVLLIAAIIFFFLKALPYKETVDKEACRNSVILRNNAILRGEEMLPETIPLNCKTQEITISSTNEDFIKREIANAMYDCWWMLGEGKMQFWSESTWKEFGLANVKASCVICSIIKFDKSVKAKNLKLDVASYMEQTKIPNKNITYLEYFTDETGAKLPTDVQAPPITTDSDYVILFMGIEGDELWEPILRDLEVAASLATGITGTSFIAGSATGGIGGGFRAAGSLWKSIGGVLGKSVTIGAGPHPNPWLALVGEKAGGVTIAAWQIIAFLTLALVTTQEIWTAKNQKIVAQRCNGERKGCMQVMLLPMDASTIGQVCSNIESIP